MTYTVIAEPDGRFWLLTVPAIDRFTQARSVREIPVMVKDLIELFTGEVDAELDVQFQLPDSVRAHLAKVDEARTLEDQSRRIAADELRAAARDLRERRMSYHDVGQLLGVSHQRAHQLVNG